MMPEAERIRDSVRLAVDRRIKQVLDEMPCFCTPQRPELGRGDWCAKHWVLKRLDPAALADEVVAGFAMPDESTQPG